MALTVAFIDGPSASWVAEPRRSWWMEHLLLLEFLRGTSSDPCCFSSLSTTCHLQPHLEPFADDCLDYRSIRNSQDQVTLQHGLDNLIRWFKQWGMRFNPAKNKVMRTIGGIKSHRFYHMDGQMLQKVQKATYLGVTLSRDLTLRTFKLLPARLPDARFGPTEPPWISQTLLVHELYLTNKIRYGIWFNDMGPLSEERHWSPWEGTKESSSMSPLGPKVHLQCDQTPQRSQLETFGRLKTDRKTSLIIIKFI